jgi:ABC-type uncharacterized transport system ATPase subunit
MAKTQAELQTAILEIAEVCKKHGIIIAGTSMESGHAGEITILGRDQVLCLIDGSLDHTDVNNHVITREGRSWVTVIG